MSTIGRIEHDKDIGIGGDGVLEVSRTEGEEIPGVERDKKEEKDETSF